MSSSKALHLLYDLLFIIIQLYISNGVAQISGNVNAIGTRIGPINPPLYDESRPAHPFQKQGT